MFLILKTAAVGALAGEPLLPLGMAACVGRWLIVPVARFPLARPEGMAADFARGLTPATIFLAGLLPAGFLVAGLLGAWRVLIAIGVAHLVVLAAAGLAHARLGGVTGDVYGLAVELGELAVLMTFAARFG
jgi:adenosylcobinamide-GDP ribazoletransferase